MAARSATEALRHVSAKAKELSKLARDAGCPSLAYLLDMAALEAKMELQFRKSN